MQGRRVILGLFDNVGRDYVSRLAAGIARGRTTQDLPLETDNLHGTGRTADERLADDGIAGVILTPPLSDDRHVLALLESRRIPYVRIAPMVDSDRGSTVGIDEFEAASAVTQHLLDFGHRRIAILRGPRTHLVSMRRYNGYAAALGGKGLRVDPTLVAQGDFSRESGKAQAAALFAARPTAIFSSNDEMAVGLFEAAAAAGLNVPKDLSIVGFDDNPVAKTMRPRLTTVRQPLEEMGEAAARLLSEGLRNPGRGASHQTVPYEVIVRESAGPPAN